MPKETLKAISIPDLVETSIGTLKFFDNLDRIDGVLIYPDSHSAWSSAYANHNTSFEANGSMGLDARVLFYFNAGGVTPAMPDVPVNDFWAITMYDTQTRSQLQTSQRFPTVGSQSKGIEKNPDGSYDLYFSPKSPVVRKATGWRRFLVKAGSPFCECTVRWSHGSTKLGAQAKLNS